MTSDGKLLRLADRIRLQALRCRELALAYPGQSIAINLVAEAERLDRDALMVEQLGTIIVTSQEMLDAVSLRLEAIETFLAASTT